MQRHEAAHIADAGSNELVPVLPECAVVPSPLHIVYLKDHQMTPKISQFISFVIEQFG
ncbi:MAG: hypothetical protein WCA85_29595 [Paraburkholderia sp.]|uniref:hypothetical protein n=1 Tax=Paraburkholderia sp. TaxID=1926495 RepID=UPI003C35BFE7